MQETKVRRQVMEMLNNTTKLLESQGYQIVTEDKGLFPYYTPGLAALKGNRLLVFALAVFPVAEKNDAEIDNIERILHDSVDQNTPSTANAPQGASEPMPESQVHQVEKIAVVLSPDPIGNTGGGEIHWIVVQSLDQLTNRLRQELSL